jgi:hypothetical protein
MINEEITCTATEAGAYFHVSPKTVRTWVARYKIPCVSGTTMKEKRYRFKALVEAEMRARTSVGGRPKKSPDLGLTTPET